MKIKTAQEKATLYGLLMKAKFRPEQLMPASTAASKLSEGWQELKDGNKMFVDGEIELKNDEISLLKELFKGKADWVLDQAEVHKSLEDKFNSV